MSPSSGTLIDVATDSRTRDPDHDRPTRRKAVRVLATLLAWLCFGIATLGLAAHFLDTQSQPLIVIAAVAWVLALFSLPALVLLLVSRHWISAVVIAALLVAQIAVYAPLFVSQSPPTDGTTVRVMTQNMYLGQADAAQIVGRVRSEQIDVLMLEELTPEARARLDDAGLSGLLPYAWAKDRSGASGSGIWSRFPLSHQVEYDHYSMATLSAQITLAGGASATVVVVHPPAPYPASPGGWWAQMAALGDLLSNVSTSAPVIVGGDFNATTDSARFRHLLTGGYRDAAEQAGAGLIRSWPADRSFPPVIGIDHVLTRGAVATSAETQHTHGTDHLGLIASVVVP